MNNARNSSIGDLILISIASVLKKKKRCSYGSLVRETFTLFPETFSLAEFPDWPDSLKLDRPLRELREKGLITGSPTTYYSLTRLGESVVRKVGQYSTKKSEIVQPKPTRSPDLYTLNQIERSKEFQKFIADKKVYAPNNMRIRELTRFTLETPNKTVRNFLTYLKNIAGENKRRNTVEFLNLHIDFLKKGGN